MKILRTDAELTLPTLDDALRADGHDLTLVPDGITEKALAAAVAETECLLMCYTPVTARVIAAAPRLRAIVKYGVGIDAIDIPAARARGITVVNIPAYAETTVAEGAFLLLIALRRKLAALRAEMETTGWTWPEPRWIGSDIRGMTLGIVGLGRIGRALAHMAGAGFSARILAYSPHTPDNDFAALGVTRAETLPELLARSDAVSLHCTLNETTRHIIGAAELAAMQPHAVLVNTSRGALVDEAALIRALDEGKIAGAGLDVFSREPLALANHPLAALFHRDNVILLPHLTFFTNEAMQRLEDDTRARIAEVAAHRPVTIRSTDPRLQGQSGAVYTP